MAILDKERVITILNSYLDVIKVILCEKIFFQIDLNKFINIDFDDKHQVIIDYDKLKYL